MVKFDRDIRFSIGLLAIAISFFIGAVGQFNEATAQAPPREVNLTADSAPGWLPSIELEEKARKTALDFLAALDQGRYTDAYNFFAELNRRQESPDAFATRGRTFNAKAGAALSRKIVKITWTKDPAQAPAPGIYAAIDIVSRFKEIDRHCGFIILYQAPSYEDFTVMRQEDNYMDNAEARRIAQQSSPADVAKMWARLSAHCPNSPNPASSH